MSNEKDLTLKEAFDLAIKNHQEGKTDIAQDLYNQVLKIDPNYTPAHNNLGILFQQSREYQKAKDCFEKIIKTVPNFPNVHNNLGITYNKLGESQKAISSFEKAIEINPKNIFALNNLGILFYELKEYQKAKDVFEKVIQIDANNIASINGLLLLLPSIQINHALKNDNTHLKKLLLFLFKKNPIQKYLFNITKLLLFSKNDCNQLEKYIEKGSSLLSSDFIKSLLKEELFHLLIQKFIIVDLFLEKLLTRLRGDLLFALAGPDKNILKDYSNFIISLAEQCWLNEYVYINSEKENDAVDKLKNKIENDKEINEIEIAILGCYSPLNTSKIISEKLLNYQSENILFNDLINVQINEPLKEIELKKSIKSLDKIVDPVSIKVQEQYEENPYPRWRYIYDNIKLNFVLKLNQTIDPNKVEYSNKFNSPNILIAGCGTGSHPIICNEYKNANILGVDLSLASLAYAIRKTSELNIKNIEYLQADILQLKKLNKTFDIIESGGVLHHIKDPLAGLKVLLGILEPHGYLKLGLYSEIARRDVVKAREFIKQQNFKNTHGDIILSRQEIINIKKDPLLKKVTLRNDFYTTSTVRDLLFHVQEHRFTIPQISKILQDLNLEFLGFTFAEPKIKIEYLKIFPHDKKCISLDNWHQFELNNPDTFYAMYVFWVKKLP